MSQNITLPAIISAAQSRRAGTAAPMKDEGRKMKAEDSQQTMARALQPKKVDREPWTVSRRPYSRQSMPRELRSNPSTARSAQCTNARISLENRHSSPLLGTLGAPSGWQSSLSMSLQQHEIGSEARPPRRPRNLVAAAEKRHIEFRL
jgi:hypothetical protein